ncbi:hypothetical protein ACOSQ2_007116 [Xanthoceras sorbifolium]
MIFPEVSESPSTEELQGDYIFNNLTNPTSYISGGVIFAGTITMGDGKQELGEFSENTSTLALMVYNPVICYIKIKQPVRSDSRDRRATMVSNDTGSKGQRMRE